METENRIQKIIVTGTMVYGPASHESDIDIVMLSGDAETFADKIEKMGVSLEYAKDKDPQYDGYKFKIPPMPPINIIVARDFRELESWLFATNKMKNMVPVENKADRVMIFSGFRDRFFSENTESFDPFEDI